MLKEIIVQKIIATHKHDIRRLRPYRFLAILHPGELKLFPGGHVWSARRLDIRKCVDISGVPEIYILQINAGSKCSKNVSKHLILVA